MKLEEGWEAERGKVEDEMVVGDPRESSVQKRGRRPRGELRMKEGWEAQERVEAERRVGGRGVGG